MKTLIGIESTTKSSSKFDGPEKDRFKSDGQIWLTKASHNSHCVVIFSLHKTAVVRFLSRHPRGTAGTGLETAG